MLRWADGRLGSSSGPGPRSAGAGAHRRGGGRSSLRRRAPGSGSGPAPATAGHGGSPRPRGPPARLAAVRARLDQQVPAEPPADPQAASSAGNLEHEDLVHAPLQVDFEAGLAGAHCIIDLLGLSAPSGAPQARREALSALGALLAPLCAPARVGLALVKAVLGWPGVFGFFASLLPAFTAQVFKGIPELLPLRAPGHARRGGPRPGRGHW